MHSTLSYDTRERTHAVDGEVVSARISRQEETEPVAVAASQKHNLHARVSERMPQDTSSRTWNSPIPADLQ
jgi:hypothetical protein